MATILEGLNAISQAVGGTGEAESNLEALNAISAALGGSADAENNADAIANIAENASGGGGGSDHNPATVTITNNGAAAPLTVIVDVYLADGGVALRSVPQTIAQGSTSNIQTVTGTVVYKATNRTWSEASGDCRIVTIAGADALIVEGNGSATLE